MTTQKTVQKKRIRVSDDHPSHAKKSAENVARLGSHNKYDSTHTHTSIKLCHFDIGQGHITAFVVVVVFVANQPKGKKNEKQETTIVCRSSDMCEMKEKKSGGACFVFIHPINKIPRGTGNMTHAFGFLGG